MNSKVSNHLFICYSCPPRLYVLYLYDHVQPMSLRVFKKMRFSFFFTFNFRRSVVFFLGQVSTMIKNIPVNKPIYRLYVFVSFDPQDQISFSGIKLRDVEVSAHISLPCRLRRLFSLLLKCSLHPASVFISTCSSFFLLSLA